MQIIRCTRRKSLDIKSFLFCFLKYVYTKDFFLNIPCLTCLLGCLCIRELAGACVCLCLCVCVNLISNHIYEVSIIYTKLYLFFYIFNKITCYLIIFFFLQNVRTFDFRNLDKCYFCFPHMIWLTLLYELHIKILSFLLNLSPKILFIHKHARIFCSFVVFITLHFIHYNFNYVFSR